MKKAGRATWILLVAFFLVTVSQAQPLTGTKNIPGDYATLAAAITQLNLNGTAAPGVTFNLASGHIENGINLTLNTTTSSASAPIVFQKAPGATVHPRINALGGSGGSMDGIIITAGTDYVTFDGIDLTAADNTVEWGYAMVKKSSSAPFDGCQNLIIRNCVITMNRSNTTAIGIYSGNHTAASTSSLTITATTDATSNCKFYGNTITNVYYGILLNGYNAPNPYTLYDQNNEVGVDGPNTITNFGGGYGVSAIYAQYQNGINISNNVINTGTVTAAPTSSLSGIILASSTNAGGTVSNNAISLAFTGGTGQTMYGINLNFGSGGGGNTLNVNGNSIINCSATGTGSLSFYGIYNALANNGPSVINMNNNTVHDITVGGTGTIAGIDGGVAATINMNGNTVYNLNLNAPANVYLLKAGTGTLTMHDNILHDVTVASGTGSLYGMYDYSYPGSETYYNNQVYNIAYNGAGTIYGMYFYTTSGTRQSYANVVHTLSSNGGLVYGMYYGSSTPTIYRNTIYDLVSNTATGQVIGMYLYSGSNVLVYNNFISDLRTPSSTQVNAISGINIYSSNPTYLHDNTIYLNATSTSATTFGTAGIYSSTANSVNMELRNNIVVNTSTPVFAGGAAYTVALQRSTASLSSYQTTSNNNLFYAGTPGPNNLVYFDGTNGDQSLPLFKARVTPRESASVSEMPPFVNVAAHDLHIQAGTATQVESGGLRITTPTAITTDYDGDTRWGETGYAGTGTAPDIGADEGNFIPMAAMGYTSSQTDQVTGNTFSGTTGQAVIRIRVTVSGASAPVYVTQFSLNASGTTAITDINAAVSRIMYTGNSSVFGAGIQFGTALPTLGNYTISGSQALMPGDNYFWLTVDVIQTALTGHLIDGQCLSLTVGGVQQVPSVTSPVGNLTILGPMSGTYLVGAGNSSPNFITLTEAINHLNHRGVGGPVILSLTNPASTPYNAAGGEVFPITVGVIPLASAVNTVTLQPAAGLAPVITGSSTTSILKLNGTDYFTINGSGTAGNTRDLRIENTSTGNWVAALQLASLGGNAGCLYITVKNCILRGGSPGSNSMYTYAVSVGAGIGAQGDNNQYLTMDNNEISRAFFGLYIGGTGNIADNLAITNNTIGSDDAGYYIGNIALYMINTQGTINGNTIKGVSSATTTPYGIVAGPGVRNTLISRNNIHAIRGQAGSGYAGTGISVDLASPGNNVTIANNLIYDISGEGSANISSYGLAGIKISGISTNVKVYYNSICLSGQISRAAATGDISAAIYVWSTATQVDIRNNILANSIENTTGDAKAYGLYSEAPASAFSFLDYNDYSVTGREAVFAYFGGADRTSLAALQAASGKDANSIASDPNFNSTQVLIPYPGSAELDRCPAVAVTDDYLGATRTAPTSMGAYEAGNDVTPPVVSYTPLYNTHLLTARTLTATITDYYSTVPTSGSGLPRLYWRINSNPWNTVTGTWISGNTYQFNFGNWVAMGDQVSYFIVCQDNMAVPNTGATPAAGATGLTASPPACTTPPASPQVYSIVGSLSGVKNIPGDYPSLTGANGFFADMNSKTLSGPLTVRIGANLAEDGTNALNEINTEDPAYRLTITNNGAYHIVSGSYSGALIRFNGTDNVILNGKGKLQITNTISNPSIALQFSGGCNGNTIDSCTFNTGYMVWNNLNYCIYFTGPGSNNQFRYDSISKSFAGIYMHAGYWGQASGNVIYRNVIGSATSANYIYNNGIYAQYQDNLLISRNQVYNLIGNYSPIAIYTEGITNSIIEKNDIRDVVYNGTSYGGASGITLKALNPSPNVTIRNNLIRHIAGMGNSPNTGDYNNIPAGIKLFGTATSGIYLYYNSVYLTPDGSYGLFFNNEWFTALEIGAGVSGITMKNNILQNSVGEYTGRNITTWGYGVYTKGAASPFSSVNGNLYFTSNADNNYVGLNGTAVPPVNNMTLAQWKVFTGQDALSLNADPLYISVTNLTPQAGSPAIGAGIPIPGTVDDDVNGNPRGPSVTMGAIEMVPATAKTLTLNLLLQGLFNSGGTMRAAWDNTGPHWGSQVADHITIELHDATPGNYSTILYTATDVSLTTAGQAIIQVPAAYSGSYYITIRHRNSLPTVTSAPVSLAGASTTYSFDLPAKAFGSKLVSLPGGGYGLYTGDVNQDGSITQADLTLAGTGSGLFATGYQAADINGDGTVDSADMTFVDNHAASGITASTP